MPPAPTPGGRAATRAGAGTLALASMPAENTLFRSELHGSELELLLVRLTVARALDLVLPEVGRPLPLLPLRHRLEIPEKNNTHTQTQTHTYISQVNRSSLRRGAVKNPWYVW